MGCHTWCYKKERDINNKELLIEVKRLIKKDLDFFERHGKREEKDFKLHIKKLNRFLTLLNNGIVKTDEFLGRLYDQFESGIKMYVNGSLYSDSEFHDIFRIKNYPEDILLSKEETLSFIKENKLEVNYERVNSFWSEHPDGMIEFG